MQKPFSKTLCFIATLCFALNNARGESEPDVSNRSSSVPNFSLLDYRGKNYELSRSDSRVVVLYFTGIGCPIARQNYPKIRKLSTDYGKRGVTFWMINAETQKDYNEPTMQIIAQMGLNDKLSDFIPKDEEGKEAISRLQSMKNLNGVQSTAQLIGDPDTFRLQVIEGTLGTLTLLRDENQLLTHHLEVTRLSEVVAIDTVTKKVIYRGAIDDQMSPGAKKPAATKTFLVDALDEFLAEKPVSVPRTPAQGCLITFAAKLRAKGPSYTTEIAPVIQAKCASCHSEGRIGPFPLASYGDVRRWSAMIQEVILDRRMPPWDADPHFGKFSNDMSLTPAEAQTLMRWIELDCPRGDGNDPLTVAHEPEAKWKLGEPDFIVRLPERQQIPETGVLDYRYLKSDFVMPEDSWVRASVIHPDNPQVVHHVIVRLIYPEGYQGDKADSYLFTMWAPGIPQAECPPDTGVFVPKGARFQFEVHYTTNGTAHTDQSEMGLYLAKEKPKMRLDTRIAENRDLIIPPGEPNAEHIAYYCFKRDAIIYNIGPHMHLRGSWFRFQLLHPDGKRETILNIPRYDFNWQIGHVFEKPKHVSAGTWLVCTGGFDNSERNPHNPNASKQVKFGLQTSDEMFMGFMSTADLPDQTK